MLSSRVRIHTASTLEFRSLPVAVRSKGSASMIPSTFCHQSLKSCNMIGRFRKKSASQKISQSHSGSVIEVIP